MSNYEPASRLAWTLRERFGDGTFTVEFRRLNHDRLMEESQRHLAHTALAGSPADVRVACRILDSKRDYGLWEAEHATLMRRIAAERLPGVQKAQLLNISLSLIHRKALFEYLRDEQVRGGKREDVISHFFSRRDYASAVVSEHGRYVRSAASYLCSSHVGSHVMFDALFEDPLAQYEDLYASYFRTYCDTVLADDRNSAEKLLLPVLIDLKAQVGEWRKALIALTHSQSGTWRRPTFR